MPDTLRKEWLYIENATLFEAAVMETVCQTLSKQSPRDSSTIIDQQ